MCRLLAFSSLERKSFYDVVGNEFDNFVAMSSEHKDGWGIGYEGTVIKDIKPAKESNLLTETGANLETNGALFHLRLASKGITVNIDNNHPFTQGTTTFMHNGTIRPGNTAEEFVADKYKGLIQGTTDSELRFTKRGDDMIVASTGWGNTDWNHLANHQMLVVDRSTLEYSVSAL